MQDQPTPAPARRVDQAATDELARFPLFGSLATPALETLAVLSTRLTIGAGEVIFTRLTRADCCYGVLRGTVELVRVTPSGQAKVVELVRPGQTFGEAVMFLERPFPVDAVAGEDAQLVRIPSSAIDTLLDEDPGAARAMLASLSIRLHSLIQDVEMYTVRSARERVVAHVVGSLDGEGRAVFLPTKRSVASRLGITPETLSRVLRDLTDAGLVVPDGSGVLVPDAAALRAAARA